MTDAMEAPSRSRLPLVAGAGVLALLLVLALLAGRSNRSSGPALSPRSTAPDGTRALVLLLERFGGNVRLGDAVPSAGDQVALLLRDRLDHAHVDQVIEWVRAGGTLVVTDPSSELSAVADAYVPGLQVGRGLCTAPGLDDAQLLDLGDRSQDPDPEGGSTYRIDSTVTTSCFGDNRSAYVTVRAMAKGRIVSLGGANPLTNRLIDEADNSVLAISLLLPRGATTVSVLDPNPPGQGDRALVDLIPSRVTQAILQLLVAFVLYALWRGRRLGRPVTDPQPVPIAGSRLVDAVGKLHQRTGSTDRAATTLRGDLVRQLTLHYGLPAGAPSEAVAEVVAQRTGLDRDRVARTLSARTVIADEEALVMIARELDSIRQEVLDARR
jgi:hypothetical protein